jgi:putative ABC transport system permease protein
VRSLDRKLRRDLWHHKLTLAAVASIVALGVACLVGMGATYINITAAIDDYYADCRMADVWVDLRKAPVSRVKALRDLPGVTGLRDRIASEVRIDLPERDVPASGRVLSLPDTPRPVLNDIVLLSGTRFTPDEPEQVIISDDFAAANGLRPGNSLKVVLNGQFRELTIVGTAISSEFVYLTPPGSIAPDPEIYGALWIKRSFAEEVFGYEGACNSALLTLTPAARAAPAEILDRIQTELDDFGVFSAVARPDQFSHMTLMAEVQGLQMFAVAMPVIFLGIAALILNVMMVRIAESQRTIIGTLKALGVGDGAILTHFLKFGLVVGLIGGIAGGLMGFAMAGGMTVVYADLFNFPSLPNHFHPWIALVGIGVSALFAMLGTLRGAQRVMALKPAEAMREAPPLKATRTILERVPIIWNRLGFRWRMVLRGLARNKRRAIIGLGSAAFGGALMLYALGAGDSLHDMLDFQFDRAMRADVTVEFREIVDRDALRSLRRLPGVSHVEGTLVAPVTFIHGHRDKRGAITGMSPDARLTIPPDATGAPLRLPATGLLMTRRLADQLAVTPGESITIEPIRGDRSPREVVIAGYAESTFGLAVYADYDFLAHLLGESAPISAAQLTARFTPDQRREFLAELHRSPVVAKVNITAEQRERIETLLIDKMAGALSVMILFAGVIFFGSILNSALISLAERRREIATFRVLGYSSGEVGSIFLREALLINLTGALIGMPMGVGMLAGLAMEFSNDMFALRVVAHPISYVTAMGLAVLFILAAHMVVQRSINRMEWPDALKMKE